MAADSVAFTAAAAPHQQPTHGLSSRATSGFLAGTQPLELAVKAASSQAIGFSIPSVALALGVAGIIAWRHRSSKRASAGKKWRSAVCCSALPPTASTTTVDAQKSSAAPVDELSAGDPVLRRVDAKSLLPPEQLPRLDPATGCPVEVKGVPAPVNPGDPPLVVHPLLLSKAECEHVLSLAEGCWRPSVDASFSTFEKTGEVSYGLSDTRTSWSCKLRPAQTAVLDRIERRLAEAAGLRVEQLERLNLVRYAPGEFFGVHQDGGRFRPKTAFFYLNDLPADDEGGDTYFPRLGLGFKACEGSAVVWPNITEGGEEDHRTVHGAKAPEKGIKYGSNCFFNNTNVRRIRPSPYTGDAELQVVDVRELGEPQRVRVLSHDPRISAVAQMMDEDQVKHLRQLVSPDLSRQAAGGTRGDVDLATKTLRILEPEETETVAQLEDYLAFLSMVQPDQLCRLRVVEPSAHLGFSNRGLGNQAAYVCLNEREEVVFPGAGLRVVLRAGDCLSWNNVVSDGEMLVEDSRTFRVHIPPEKASGSDYLGIDAFVHDENIRTLQQLRPFVRDGAV
eukprot:TRINITY_DN112963_c0_g1_i1.p1 TRINITY_DN112963_c0_g1~~TRINITY_DN112963_c0_g1_i1.p1  ORF type:complete len:562 (+),score=66.48 TRINITY_DN112963_c0_g1_i1:70-1755(+)